MISIESNIPAPVRRHRRGASAKYPFRDMLPGDSFEIKDDGKGAEYTRRKVYNSASQFVRYNNLDWVFTAIQTESGARIFRIK